jgi:hypothetical protein
MAQISNPYFTKLVELFEKTDLSKKLASLYPKKKESEEIDSKKNVQKTKQKMLRHEEIILLLLILGYPFPNFSTLSKSLLKYVNPVDNTLSSLLLTRLTQNDLNYSKRDSYWRTLELITETDPPLFVFVSEVLRKFVIENNFTVEADLESTIGFASSYLKMENPPIIPGRDKKTENMINIFAKTIDLSLLDKLYFLDDDIIELFVEPGFEIVHIVNDSMITARVGNSLGYFLDQTTINFNVNGDSDFNWHFFLLPQRVAKARDKSIIKSQMLFNKDSQNFLGNFMLDRTFLTKLKFKDEVLVNMEKAVRDFIEKNLLHHELLDPGVEIVSNKADSKRGRTSHKSLMIFKPKAKISLSSPYDGLYYVVLGTNSKKNREEIVQAFTKKHHIQLGSELKYNFKLCKTRNGKVLNVLENTIRFQNRKGGANQIALSHILCERVTVDLIERGYL